LCDAGRRFAHGIGPHLGGPTQRTENPGVFVANAAALRATGELIEAIAALGDALTIDPFHYFALLSRGTLGEPLSGAEAASRIYRNALKHAPAADKMPAPLAAQSEHARRVVEADQAALEHFLEAELSAASALTGSRALRFREYVDIRLGKAKPVVQEPFFFRYPQLPPITFFFAGDVPVAQQA
jgi:aspartate beta-hydroxylase